MRRIGLFFGSDSGYTEEIAGYIKENWGDDVIDLHDIRNASPEDFKVYEQFIIGTSTWNDGELVSGWYDFYDNLDDMDFTGKTVALFGLGDQVGYGEYYVDGMGILGKKIRERGARLIGRWPIGEYYYCSSKAVEDELFLGLALDEMNQPDLTQERVDAWLAQIKKEFSSPIEPAALNV